MLCSGQQRSETCQDTHQCGNCSQQQPRASRVTTPRQVGLAQFVRVTSTRRTRTTSVVKSNAFTLSRCSCVVEGVVSRTPGIALLCVAWRCTGQHNSRAWSSQRGAGGSQQGLHAVNSHTPQQRSQRQQSYATATITASTASTTRATELCQQLVDARVVAFYPVVYLCVVNAPQQRGPSVGVLGKCRNIRRRGGVAIVHWADDGCALRGLPGDATHTGSNTSTRTPQFEPSLIRGVCHTQHREKCSNVGKEVDRARIPLSTNALTPPTLP